MPLSALPEMHVVLALPAGPPEPGKTARAYAGLRPADHTDGGITDRLVAVLRAGDPVTPSLLHNVFDRAGFVPGSELSACRDRMAAAGAGNVHLAGSGPALFSLVADRAEAEQLRRRLREHGLEACQVDTVAGAGPGSTHGSNRL